MKKNILRTLTIVFIFNLLTFCSSNKDCTIPDSLLWLTGQYADTSIQFFESWALMNDSILTGSGFQMEGSDTVFMEHLSIEKRDKQWQYIVKADSSETSFTLINAPGDTLVFENRQNEYPKRITYVRRANGGIDVSIDNPDEAGKKQVFRFKNVKP